MVVVPSASGGLHIHTTCSLVATENTTRQFTPHPCLLPQRTANPRSAALYAVQPRRLPRTIAIAPASRTSAEPAADKSISGAAVDRCFGGGGGGGAGFARATEAPAQMPSNTSNAGFILRRLFLWSLDVNKRRSLLSRASLGLSIRNVWIPRDLGGRQSCTSSGT
jgi:hypothetical protein